MTSDRGGPLRWRGPDWRDGTAGADRFPLALSEGYFDVDERGFPELVALLGRYARNLSLSGPHDDPRSWFELFAGTVPYVLADIAATDVAREHGRRMRLLAASDAAGLAEMVHDLARRMEIWEQTLSTAATPGARLLGRKIRRAMWELMGDRLAAERLLTAGDGVPRVWRLGRPWSRRWTEEGAEEQAEAPAGEADGVGDEAGSGSGAAESTNTGAYRFVSAVAAMRRASRALLEETLDEGTLDPAIGLALAFVRLFGRAQQRLNELGRRRLEFYYLDVLGFRPTPLRPDVAHVTLSPAPGVRSVVVPEGTRFLAGRDASDRDIVFASEEALELTDARVASIGGLYFERSLQVSPESELGFVTGVRYDWVDLADVTAGREEDVALFDLSTPLAGSRVRVDTDLGFALASPILELAEGDRRIRVAVRMRPLELLPDASGENAGSGSDGRSEAVRYVAAAGSEAELSRRLGRVVTNEVLSASPTLDRQDRDMLADELRGRTSVDGLSAEVLREVLHRDRSSLFTELFRHSLEVRYTAPEGWAEVGEYYITRLESGYGLEIVLDLGPGAPPVTGHDSHLHGPGYEAGIPVVSFRVGARAIFHPYSLLAEPELESVDVEVSIRGVRNLVAHNQLGRLDPSKPFAPFGPLPTLDSYLSVGSPEAARKPLVEATLTIEWSGLPRSTGGWSSHYGEYGERFGADAFRAEVSVLRDGRWEPQRGPRRPHVSLFEVADDGRLKSSSTLDLGVLEYLRADPEQSDEELRTSGGARNGLFRLSLSPSDTDFGHAVYPGLLTRTLTENARSRKARPLPNPPYTPMIAGMALDYRARAHAAPGGGSGSSAAGARIYHDYPFGTRDLGSAPLDERLSLMPGGPGRDATRPPGEEDGYLYVGFSGSEPEGPLTLLVQMVAHRMRFGSAPVSGVSWYYLASNRWQRLEPGRVLSDSTNGLRNSGIVTLDLPAGVTEGNTVMPSHLRWLAAGGKGMESVAQRLHSVTAGAVRVSWEADGGGRTDLVAGLPPGRISDTAGRLKGVEGVRQVGTSFGGRESESYEDLVCRASERLRHKNRAATPWDYERLVLERFPDVAKVKCLPHTDALRYPSPSPGDVMIVVVPHLVRPGSDEWRMPMLTERRLELIRDFLSEVSPPAASITVRNPAFELVQIRCKAVFRSGTSPGRWTAELNEALIELIAPWRSGGLGGRFGWTLTHREVAAYIHRQPFVDFVTDVSLLHMWEHERRAGAPNRFVRYDTATGFEEGCADPDGSGCLDGLADPVTGERLPLDTGLPPPPPDQVEGRYPWSLCVPSRRHYLEAVPDVDGVEEKITGIGELEIGHNFILEFESDAHGR